MPQLYLSEAELTGDYVRRLGSWVSTQASNLPWRDFGAIPYRYASGGTLQRTRDVLNARFSSRNPFWWRTPAHAPLFRKLVARHGRASGALFRFLCMGEALDPTSTREAGLEAAVEAGCKSGLFRESDEGWVCPVTLAPFRDRYYLADARVLYDERDRHDVRPVARPTQAEMQLALAEKLLEGRPIASTVEIGCGIGLISIELRSRCRSRIGVDLNPRALAFAEANRTLHADDQVRFLFSDLFEEVKSQADLLIFNPWQPSEPNLPLIERFVTELGSRLSVDGRALLVLDTATEAGVDETTGRIGERLREARLEAQRFIAHSYAVDEGIRVRSMLWIRHAPDPRAADPIRTMAGVGSAMLRVRSLVAGRSSKRRARTADRTGGA